MLQIIDRIKNSNFVGNFSTLLFGTIISQVVAIGTSLLIARIYSPEVIGIYSIAISIIMVLGNVSTLKYDLAIVLSQNRQRASSLFVIASIFSIVIALVFFVFGNIYIRLSDSSLDISSIIAISLGIGFTGLSLSIKGLLIYHKSFKKISLANIFRSLVISIVQLSGYFFSPVAAILIHSRHLGEFFSHVFSGNLRNALGLVQVNTSKHLRYYYILLKKYSDFPIFNTSKTLINSLSQNAVIFTLSIYSGNAVVGYYGMAYRILQLPINFISQSLNHVFYQKASEMHNEKKSITSIYFGLTGGLGIIGILPLLLILLYGEYFFNIILGLEWKTSGVYAKYIAIWMFFVFMNTPSISIMQILRKQNILLIYEVFNFTFRILILIYGGHYLTDLETIKYFCYSGALMNVILILIGSITILISSKKSL